MHVNEILLSFISSHNLGYVYIEALLLTMDICCLATKTVVFPARYLQLSEKRGEKEWVIILKLPC